MMKDVGYRKRRKYLYCSTWLEQRALRIVYHLATRVPRVMVQRVEEVYPHLQKYLEEMRLLKPPGEESEETSLFKPTGEDSEEVRLLKPMGEESEKTSCAEALSDVIEAADPPAACQNEAVVPVETTDVTEASSCPVIANTYSLPGFPLVQVKQEVVDEDDACVEFFPGDSDVVVKTEVKEEITVEEHGVSLEGQELTWHLEELEAVVGEEEPCLGFPMIDSVSGGIYGPSSPCQTVPEAESPDSLPCTSAQLPETTAAVPQKLPQFEFIRVKTEDEDDEVWRKRRYKHLRHSSVSLTPESSSAESSPKRSHLQYMVKFPERVVRSLNKKRCSLCRKSFRDDLMLAEHVRLHTRKFSCSVCSAVFQCDGALKGHIRVHVGERPYHCRGCKTQRCNRTCT